MDGTDIYVIMLNFKSSLLYMKKNQVSNKSICIVFIEGCPRQSIYISGVVVVHWKYTRGGAEPPGSDPASHTMILMLCRIIV